VTGSIWLQELVFFTLACACLAWAHWRTPAAVAAFPGPRPVGPVFKVWLVIIWAVGLVLPIAALAIDGFAGSHATTRAVLLPYLLMFAAQVASELFCWKRLRSPIWVLVPCLYLPWRLWQSVRGLDVVGDDGPALTVYTLYALAVLWIINIGVHYTNIPRTLRWDYHAPDSTFPSLHDPRVFTRGAQDQRDPH
jgi:hypothetical protein